MINKNKNLYSLIKQLFIISKMKDIKEITKNIDDKFLFIKNMIKVIIQAKTQIKERI